MNERVSILIATRNRAQSLAATLASFDQLVIPSSIGVELIVIDNGSTDHTNDLLANTRLRFPIRSVRIEQPGKSRCMNNAAQIANGQALLFTDDDVRPDKYWLARMAQPILNDVADAAQGSIHLADYLLKPWLTEMQRGWIAERKIDSTEITNNGSLTGANMCISRDVFLRLGGFDENLGPGALGLSEESLLALRLNDAGHRTIYIADAAVEHHCSADRITRSSLLKSAEQIGRSLGYIYYHWLHMSAPWPTLREWKHSLELWALRSIRPGINRQVAIEDWELNLVQDRMCWKQFAIERKHPARYEKRTEPKCNNVVSASTATAAT